MRYLATTAPSPVTNPVGPPSPGPRTATGESDTSPQIETLQAPRAVGMVRMMSSPVVQQAYSSIAPVYIDLFGSLTSVHADDLAIIQRHLTHLDGPVVDVGCGPGHLTGYLHAAGCEVTGIDPVPEFVD